MFCLVGVAILDFTYMKLILQILLFGSDNYDTTINKSIISFVIDFIIKSKRFDEPLIQ